jgi:hypothetical protein
MDRIKKIFQSISIENFVNYYNTFDKYKDSKSNQEIIEEFKIKGEDWTDKSCTSRAQKGKKIFKEDLQLDALRYIINSANKVQKEIRQKAQEIYSLKQGLYLDPNFFSSNTEPYTIDKLLLDAELRMVEKQTLLSKEEKKALVKIRLGQSFYRNELIGLWGGCSVTGCENTSVLIASHIKAYRDCKEQEHYDKYNGLLLSPCYDKLFDLYLISFAESGEIMISKTLLDDDLKALKISRKDRLIKLFPENQKYLKYHRAEFLKNEENE